MAGLAKWALILLVLAAAVVGVAVIVALGVALLSNGGT